MDNKERKPNKWILALKTFNSNRNNGMWCLPKKGSEEYEQVKAIMEGKEPKKQEEPMKMEEPKKEEPKKKIRKVKIIEEPKKEEPKKEEPKKEEPKKEDKKESETVESNYKYLFNLMNEGDQETWREDGDDKKVLAWLKKYKIVLPRINSKLDFAEIPDYIYDLDTFKGKLAFKPELFDIPKYASYILSNDFFIPIIKQLRIKVSPEYYEEYLKFEDFRTQYYEMLINGPLIVKNRFRTDEKYKDLFLELFPRAYQAK
jgi:hypothetical protein